MYKLNTTVIYYKNINPNLNHLIQLSKSTFSSLIIMLWADDFIYIFDAHARQGLPAHKPPTQRISIF